MEKFIVFPCDKKVKIDFSSEVVESFGESNEFPVQYEYEPYFFLESYSHLREEEFLKVILFYDYLNSPDKLSQLKIDLFLAAFKQFSSSISYYTSEDEIRLKIREYLCFLENYQDIHRQFLIALKFLFFSVRRSSIHSTDERLERMCNSGMSELISNFKDLKKLIIYYDSNDFYSQNHKNILPLPIIFLIFNGIISLDSIFKKYEKEIKMNVNELLDNIHFRKTFVYKFKVPYYTPILISKITEKTQSRNSDPIINKFLSLDWVFSVRYTDDDRYYPADVFLAMKKILDNKLKKILVENEFRETYFEFNLQDNGITFTLNIKDGELVNIDSQECDYNHFLDDYYFDWAL